ncbi:MAG: antibiotic biosynthesis monooxygenase [bacterium]|nr:antibiotic biosynthesis monooxygenase [bacterium]
MPEYQFVIAWRFKVKPGREQEFEAAYGPVGDWVRLFSNHDGYLGTELMRDSHDDRVYLTIDRWRSADDFNQFKELYLSEYEQLDRILSDLTESETLQGYYLTEV